MQDNNKKEREKNEIRKEIDMVELFMIVKQNWKVLFRTIFIMVALGFTYSYYKADTYKAEVILMVSGSNLISPDRLENSQVSLNQKLVSTYTEIAQSSSIMRDVVQKLDLKNSPESLARKVEVAPVGMTELIKISYEDENPQKAALIVNHVSEEFMIKIKSVMRFDNLKIIESSRVPVNPESKKTKLIIAISMIIGILLGIFEVMWGEYYQNKIKNPEDIERLLDCQVLANVPDYSTVKLDKKSNELKKVKKR
ncbi:YveK family protein [Ilyobacter polytropus]|uniref:Lipopolysaccharide biosynthesis protein n=1 Tax=Ilyobacter polytropus (strain ATCC 51220 / DSM 2926 / LMG 16218 / CuHBu1) TaxID=572544 RepID=E3H7M4_ILYPC|nr:Wzz/FepE/Etk N-terminal domain-containing protein [Ilyobacter polytropus]ADO82606.1 lipopolysaccharide biosynthesis protein [Ilyobacter polytropus DSM 2926]